MKTLVPYYFVNSRIAGWTCSECSQTFDLQQDEPLDSEEPLLRIQQEFRAHHCEQTKSSAAVA